jgi:predicted membrane chloride channel (bestrophin family)
MFSFLMLLCHCTAVGIDEIAVEIEEPFCILPLLPLCRTIVSDVAIAHAAVEAC